MATASDELKTNIENLTSAIHELKKTSLAPPVNPLEDIIDKPDFFMTSRQIAKKIMLVTSGTVPGIIGEPSIPKIDEETAHMAIYGKMLKDENGKLIDNEVLHPECVEWVLFKRFPDSTEDFFPMKDTIEKMKTEVKEAIKGLFIKAAELGEAVSKAGIEISVGAGAFVDAVTNIPKPQPSLALSSVLGIMSSVSKLQAKVMEIVPLLSPLLNITVLLPVTILDTVLSAINVVLVILTTLMVTITQVTKPATVIKKLIPSTQSAIDSMVKQSLSGTVNGTVIDNSMGIPIAGASVKINTMPSVVTDSKGYYSVEKVDVGTSDGSAGTASITVTAPNYKTASGSITVESGKTTKADIVMFRGH